MMYTEHAIRIKENESVRRVIDNKVENGKGGAWETKIEIE